MRFKIDADTCIGCGLCASICPEVFEMDDDVATVILDPVPEAHQAAAIQAEEECPVEAITHI